MSKQSYQKDFFGSFSLVIAACGVLCPAVSE